VATINDLNISITKLSHLEAFDVIRRIRQSRLVKKITKFTLRMDRANKKPKAKTNPLDVVSKEMLLKLLRESLEDGHK